MFPPRNYPRGSKINPLSYTLNNSSRADGFRVTVQPSVVNLTNIKYPHTKAKGTILPCVSTIHKEYPCSGILIDIAAMQKMPRPTFTLGPLHNVGNDNGNSVNRTKEYTKLQVAVGTMTDMHHVLTESMGYSIVACLPCQHLFSNILSELHLLLAQFQLSHTCIHPQLVFRLLLMVTSLPFSSCGYFI